MRLYAAQNHSVIAEVRFSTSSASKDSDGVCSIRLRFPNTFNVLAAPILFLGGTAITVMPKGMFPQIDIPIFSGSMYTSR